MFLCIQLQVRLKRTLFAVSFSIFSEGPLEGVLVDAAQLMELIASHGRALVRVRCAVRFCCEEEKRKGSY